MRNCYARARVRNCRSKTVGTAGHGAQMETQCTRPRVDMQCVEPASKIRLATIAIARGFVDPAGIVDTVTWRGVQERELRATRAWWRRGGGHDANYVARMDRWEIQAGRKGDEADRWPAEVITVRRPVGATGRRIGTQLDVRIRFRGTDADGNAWNDEWIPVVRLTKDLKDEARRIEIALYDPPVSDFKGHRLRMYAGLPRPRRWHHRTRDLELRGEQASFFFKTCTSARGQSKARPRCASV